MPDITLTLTGGGEPLQVSVPAGATLTLAGLLQQLAPGRTCAGCLAGTHPCPMLFHDEAAFDQSGFLQAKLRSAAGETSPFGESEYYTGVLPHQAESPQLRRALDEATMRLVYPYPCWPLCPSLQRLERGLRERELAFFRLYLARARRAYLQSDAVNDEGLAEDEALLGSAGQQGVSAPGRLGRVGARWLAQLSAPALLPGMVTEGGEQPEGAFTAVVERVGHIFALAGDGPPEWIGKGDWRYHRIEFDDPETFDMDALLAALTAGPGSA